MTALRPMRHTLAGCRCASRLIQQSERARAAGQLPRAQIESASAPFLHTSLGLGNTPQKIFRCVPSPADFGTMATRRRRCNSSPSRQHMRCTSAAGSGRTASVSCIACGGSGWRHSRENIHEPANQRRTPGVGARRGADRQRLASRVAGLGRIRSGHAPSCQPLRPSTLSQTAGFKLTAAECLNKP